ncbi:hypothetical protein [Pseudolabrys sp.]|uniref:hypothetical protein n=1 Tax=Pseudolabrys sp. TaxID=1960880 RepID=UPI003D110667
MRSFTFDALRRVGSLVDDPEQVSAMLSSVDAKELLDGELAGISDVIPFPSAGPPIGHNNRPDYSMWRRHRSPFTKRNSKR